MHISYKIIGTTFSKSNPFRHVGALRFYCSELNLDQCFSILGLSADSDQETVRRAFLLLVKRYHPDSGSPDANADKFREIESAYRIIQDRFANDRWNVNEGIGEYGLYYTEKQSDPEADEFDIKHTAPQHRQYLSHGGIGAGTPFQREKQFANYRAAKAIANVNMYRISKLQDNSEQALITRENRKRAKDIKTGKGIDRLVEDLIQESMAKGEFDNLSGSGKPLKTAGHENPYVDFVTHKLNQVLIDNGFTPTWILLQKEIFRKSSQLIETLNKERSKLGPNPLSKKEDYIWNKTKTKLGDDVAYLNDKINTYNLMVPILGKQLLQFSLEMESKKILEEGAFSTGIIEEPKVIKGKENESFIDLVSAIFK